MRFLVDYLIPLVIVGLGYIGIQKVLTRSGWSFSAKILLNVVAVIFLMGIILYEYFAERPIIDSLREATGNALCRHFVMERCPDLIKIEAADAEAARYHNEATNLRKQNRRVEAEEWTKKANEADQRAQTVREQALETRRLFVATNVVKDALGPGAKIGKSAIMENFAIISWTQNPMGGEALLKFESNKREWVIVELGGGAWDVDSLAKAAGMPREKAKIFLAKVPITGMNRELPEAPIRNRPAATAPIDEDSVRVRPSRLAAAALAKTAGFLGTWSVNCKAAPGPEEESTLAFFIDARGDGYVATYKDLGNAPPLIFALQEASVRTDELRITRTLVTKSWRGWWTYREIYRYSGNQMQLIERIEDFSVFNKDIKSMLMVGGSYAQDFVIPKLRGQPTPTHVRCVNDVHDAVRSHLEREYSFNNTMLARSAYSNK